MSNPRPLHAEELRIAQSVFKDALCYQRIRIVETKWLNTPTVLGNTIRIAYGYHLSAPTLIHELVHVWQFQHFGYGYMLNSVAHQLWSIFTTGNRSKAYAYTLHPAKNFADYTAEQQAMIVQHYYSQKFQEHQANLVQNYIHQLRAAKFA